MGCLQSCWLEFYSIYTQKRQQRATGGVRFYSSQYSSLKLPFLHHKGENQKQQRGGLSQLGSNRRPTSNEGTEAYWYSKTKTNILCFFFSLCSGASLGISLIIINILSFPHQPPPPEGKNEGK